MKKHNIKQETPATGPRLTADDILELTEEKLLAMDQDQYISALQSLVDHLPVEEKAGRSCTVKQLKQKLDLFAKHPFSSKIAGGIHDLKRQDWEINHTKIKAFMRNWLLENRSVPAVATIAKELELSRQTVYEHLNEGMTNEFYQERMKHMEYLTLDILQLLYQRLLDGNAVAGKIYLEYMMKMQQQQQTNIRQQNNYLQVNNLVLDEQRMKLLPDDDRLRVNSISAELRQIVTKYQNN